MKYQHQELASGRWQSFTLLEQLANIGSEVSRTLSWRQKKEKTKSHLAFNRALELFDLTINDPQNLRRLREITRLRELFVDFIFGNNQYFQTDKQWQKYFYYLTVMARQKR